MLPKYQYLTCCITSTYELITAMTEQARKVTYQTLAKHVGLDELHRVFPFYERSARRGLTLKNDWHVSYYKSVYGGLPCYYVCHSAIEYVFVET